MNKLILTVILTTFTAVCSFGAAAGSDASDKNKKEIMKDSSANMGKKEDKAGSVSDKDSGAMREESLSERKKEYKDQEVMDKKPYKQ